MRPVTLSMTAFGPFPGCEVIEFDKFGDSPLFLINGPTGAGKTTILDAISYALYGKTTGDEREGGQMRCDLSAVETLCEVVFDFILNDRQFSIRRVPEQQRPKTRGEGVTEQKPEAQLVELLPDGAKKLLVASKVSDATKMIEELTGLSADQFRQVMVLPQGKFRQLLLAESAQREKIFSQLFQTSIYKKLEERLKEKSATIRREREAFLHQQQGILEAVDCAGIEELKTEWAKIAEEHEEVRKTKEAAETIFLQAHQDLTSGQGIVRDFILQAEIQTKLSALDTQQQSIDQLEQRLLSAQQAAKLLPLFEQRERCQKRIAETQKKLDSARVAKTNAETQLKAAENEQDRLVSLQKERDDGKLELQQLEQHRQQLEQLATIRCQTSDLQRELAIGKVVRELLEQGDKLAQIEHLIKQTKVLKKLGDRFNNAESSGRKIADSLSAKREALKRLELAWHHGQAALLAAELKSGQACPVCGSCDHPQPAYRAEDLPDFQKLEASRAEYSALDDQLKVARESYVELRAELKKQTDLVNELSLQLKGRPEDLLSSVKESMRGLEQHLREYDQKTVTQLKQLDIAALDNQLRLLSDRYAGAEREQSLLEKGLPQDLQKVETLDFKKSELVKMIRSRQDLMEQIRHNHQRAYAGLEAANAAEQDGKQNLQQAQSEELQALEACQQGLNMSPFSDESMYLKALIADGEGAAIQIKINVFKEERQQLVGAKRELDNKLAALQPPDMERLQGVFNEAQERKQEAEQAWQRSDNRLTQLQATLQKLDTNKTRLARLDADYAVIGTLSDVAAGQTGQKVSLQRFVLSVLLDDVLIEASNRLSAMSKGRYRLFRKEDRSKGNKASGLELIVDDAYTGKVRPVATLSGGENFMAALSLALGLSEVVQAYSGGVRLDTLFIDEGFGSLDSESLDLAINTLIDLQSAGRTVGLISHVGELKEQIPLRIDVQQSRNGSRIALFGHC